MQKQIITRPRVDDSQLPAELHPVLRQIYAARGVKSAAELDNTAKGLLHYDHFSGMSGAVDVLMEALSQQQLIIIVGDFDADGATSTAVMMLGLKMLGFSRVEFLVPNRFDFGYGLSPGMAEMVVANGAELIITVDNGISCVAGVAVAKKHGVKVLVTDHHLPADVLPNADAIVNPNQQGCGFSSKNLAGVGVAFYVLSALRARLCEQGYFANTPMPKIAELLDLVALGTVADVVALDGNNRILVHQGLERIRSGRCRPGIKALLQVAKREAYKITAADLGFALGPRLNAAGRLDDMALGIECLICDDPHRAAEMAEALDQLNHDRRSIEADMQQQAEQILAQISLDGAVPDGICLYQPQWHQGVIGIVAGRIKDQHHRPTVVFALSDDGQLKGSCRSIVGLHIRDVLEQIDSQYPNLIVKFGGHAMAAGLSITVERYDTFKVAFEYVVAQKITEEQRSCQILTDGELPSDFYGLDFAQLLRRSGPWGQAFPEPVFEGTFRLVQQRLVGGKHLKLTVAHPEQSGVLLDGIYFNADLAIWPNATVKTVHMAFSLDINEFRQQQNVQLMIKEMVALH